MEVTMSSQDVSTGAIARGVAIRLAVGVAITTALLLIFLGPQRLGYLPVLAGMSHLHAPRWPLLAEAPLAIRIHLVTVVAALVLATVQMAGPKGRTFHRILGWSLAILLVTTAIASAFIRNPGGGLFNPFQLFSIWTLIAVPWGILSARSHNVRRHAGVMSGLYFGGLVFAGLLTFLPGRLLWRVFFG
jgi:uncharacterized membrane protein